MYWKEYIEQNVQKTKNGWAVSELFFWYEKDLVGWSDADNLCTYFQSYARDTFYVWLEENSALCPLESIPYDWSLNEFVPSKKKKE